MVEPASHRGEVVDGVFTCAACGLIVRGLPAGVERVAHACGAPPPRPGLGDLIADGVRWAVRHRLLPHSLLRCGGCARRRAALNRLVPFRRPDSAGR